MYHQPINIYVPRVVQIFVNPYAGGFCQKKLANCVSEYTQQGAEVIVTTDMPFAIADQHITEIMILGGDGTIRDVVTAMLDAKVDVPVSIVPVGTVNLVHRELVEDRATGECHRHFIASVGDKIMVACVSAGPDAHIVANTSSRAKKWIGRGAYGIAAIAHLVRWRRDLMNLSFGNVELECAAFYISKGRYYAGPWSFAPKARYTSPVLYGVALLNGSRVAYLKFCLAMMFGRVDRLKDAVCFECNHLLVTARNPVPLQIDGDYVGECPNVMAIHPRTVRFL